MQQGEQTALGLPPKGSAAFPILDDGNGALPDGLREPSRSGLKDRPKRRGLGTAQSGRAGGQEWFLEAAEAAGESGGGLEEDLLGADAMWDVGGARAGTDLNSAWEVGEARAAAVRAAVQKSVDVPVTPTTSSDVALGPGAVALQQLLDAGYRPPKSPTGSPSRKAGGGGFFTTLDSWIGAAQTVVRGADGVETIKLRLCTLAKQSSWETTFATLAGGSDQELGLEGFARLVRFGLGIPTHKVGDDELARLFRSIDRQQGISTVTAATLKDFLEVSEARARARVVYYHTDWEDVFCFEEGLSGDGSLEGLDLPAFFVALRREQGRVKHPIDYTPLTDHDIEHIFNGVMLACGSEPSGRITATQLEAFLTSEDVAQEA
eukprot:COSAG02_NODE_1471_length_12452_cov_7.724358_1_plen_376_part_10